MNSEVKPDHPDNAELLALRLRYAALQRDHAESTLTADLMLQDAEHRCEGLQRELFEEKKRNAKFECILLALLVIVFTVAVCK